MSTAELINRVRGKTPPAIDFSALMAALAARVQPFGDRIAATQRKYHEWHGREVARGAAVITTEPPAEVEAALAAAGRNRLAAKREYYNTVASDLRAALQARHAVLAAQVAGLATTMDEQREWERQCSEFTAACGVAALPSLLDAGITGHELRAWRDRVDRALNPPTPPPVLTAASNRLDLDVAID
jgi:hypothetical protein